jgi:pimeloyl-ACP methyl ester carboxylesterase
VVSQAARQLGKVRAGWLAELNPEQDPTLMLAAWRKRWVRQQAPPGRIACPTLVIAASNDRGVPMHHATMLHDGISGSRLVVVDGADHALIWTQNRAGVLPILLPRGTSHKRIEVWLT